MARRVIGTAVLQLKVDTSAFGNELDGLAGRLRGSFGKITGLIAGLGLGHLASQAITFGATYRTQLDNAKAAIDGLTGSQSEAQKLMSDMTTEAINTPFTLPGVTDMTTKLLALGGGFGVTSTNVIGWVHDLGNAAAATGKTTDNMNNVINIMGRISGQGRIMGRDMTQLNANLPSLHPWQILAEVTGRSESSLRKLSLKPGGLTGIVDTTTFIDALRVGMQQLPGAAADATTGLDAMDRRMATLGGSVEFFKDSIGVALADGLVPFFAALQSGMKSQVIGDALNKLIAAFSELATAIVTAIMPALPAIIDGFTSIVAALLPAAPLVGLLATMFGAMMTAIAPLITTVAMFVGWVAKLLSALDPALLGAIAAGVALLWISFSGGAFLILPLVIALVIAVATIIRQNWDTIVSATQSMVAVFVAAWQWLFQNVIEPVANFVKAIVDFFVNLYDALVGGSIIPDLVNAIVDWFHKLFDWLINIVTAIVDFIKNHWQLLIAIILGPLGIILGLVISHFSQIKSFITTAVNAIKSTVTTVFNAIKSTITTIVGGIKSVVTSTWDTIKSVTSTVWNAIKSAITSPIETAKSLVSGIVSTIRSLFSFSGLSGIVSGVFNSIRNAIVGPIQSAYDAVRRIISNITSAISHIPGAGVIGSIVSHIPHWAAGGIINSPQLALVGEAGREAVIPLSNPMRAMQLMQQAGLDRLAASMGGGGRGGPLVQMNGTVIQDATDADLVAQRTLVAMQAAMVA